MESNSIRQNLDKNDTILNIRLSLAADINKEKAVLVVEGQDDLAFFNGKIASTVDICESFSGKSGVEDIVNQFNSKHVIGICDKDYDTQKIHNIFYYDYSCLEMMMISSDEAFKSLFNEHYHCKTVTYYELRKKILQDLCWISCLRKLNSQKQWGINFNGISFPSLLNNEAGIINKKQMVKQIKESNKVCIDHQIRQLVNKECNRIKKPADYYNITNGHDFMHYFQSICNTTTKSKRKFKVYAVTSGLRCAYRKSDFERSTIYTKVLDHQDEHGLFFLAK
jgi:5S rRNA maturation endonuclease (ribonuclease M5)